MKKCLLCEQDINDFSLSSLLNYESKICAKCYQKLPVIYRHFKVADCRSYAIFSYRDKIKEILLQIKMSNDLELARNLLKPYKSYLEKKYKGYVVVAVPSSTSKNTERGFNHVNEIFAILALSHQILFEKSQEYKQSDQRFENRKNVAKIIKLSGVVDRNKKYLIVDDIVTSSQSLKACINLLKQAGVSKIQCLVVAYNCRKQSTTKDRKNSISQ